MRIIGGKFKHRLINFPDIETTRPTKDRIREAIFSALNNVDNLCCLDLYAGSGSMGLEALSRGAKYCCFIDNNLVAINVIKENIKSLGIDNSAVIFSDAYQVLDKFHSNNITFDLIFIDPPYKYNNYKDILDKITMLHLLSEHAIIVIEHKDPLSINHFDFLKHKEYHYGELSVDIFWL